MDDLDLDAFIADIEETAPQEEPASSSLLCQECGAALQNVDENYVCPDCGAQATNILQFEETELHYDESGRAVVGQRVCTIPKRNKHSVDYGWAWSTDDAVVHILSMQITALEKARLVPDHFREAVTNMWLRFWSDNIAPFIKDEYNESDLVLINAKKALKLRDIEVLVKVKDQVAIPSRLFSKREPRGWKLHGAQFYADKPAETSSSTSSGAELDEYEVEKNATIEETQLPTEQAALANQAENAKNTANEFDPKENITLGGHRNLGLDTITILTLNRTLAFIDAAARCVCCEDPLTSADIIRACNQNLLPFYGAAKQLPEGMRLDSRDKLMFQVHKPPSPTQLTHTTSFLIHKIYGEEFPAEMPVPDLNKLLARFITDMNLPRSLLDLIKDKVTFSNFAPTRRSMLISRPDRKVMRLLQYDRWAFAILLCHLKNLFNLSDSYVSEQNQIAKANVSDRIFPIGDWLSQISMRLKLILRYDPYVLYHQMADIENFELTPQLGAYVDNILDNRVTATIRYQPERLKHDATFRNELSEFLASEVPKLPQMNRLVLKEPLEVSKEIRLPIKDAIRRTRRFWIKDVQQDSEASDLIFRDFSDYKLMASDNVPQWCLFHESGEYDFNEIAQYWPESFRLLIHAGAFLCMCEPKELLNEIKHVEMYFQPHSMIIRKRGQARRQARLQQMAADA